LIVNRPSGSRTVFSVPAWVVGRVEIIKLPAANAAPNIAFTRIIFHHPIFRFLMWDDRVKGSHEPSLNESNTTRMDWAIQNCILFKSRNWGVSGILSGRATYARSSAGFSRVRRHRATNCALASHHCTRRNPIA
jgi:hypothetical protein